MDATRSWKAWLLRAGGISFGVMTQLFFVTTVYYLFLFLRDLPGRPAGRWVAVDCVLALQFVFVHSMLLLPRSRSLLSRIVPSQLYGSLFSVATCLGLWLMFSNWQSSPILVWSFSGFRRTMINAGFYASWISLIYSLQLVGLGYQTGLTQWLYWLRSKDLPRREFVGRSIYRYMRHPVYFSFLGLIWFTPRMTVDHAVLTGVWTVYIFVGSYLKDQRLTFYLGETYREYARRVPGYPGVFFGPLGKWRRLDPARPDSEIGVEPRLSRAA
jgi:isoprenylcysteine carboxyl methyltransferase (ICMT) family protein YpbQ